MTTLNWIFLSIFGISTVLFIIGYALKNIIIERIASFSIFPAIGCLATSFLIKYYPDALHINILSIAAFSTIAIAEVFLSFDKKKILFSTGVVFLLLNTSCWLTLFGTIIFFYHIPQFLTVISIIVYLSIFLICLIFIRKQKLLSITFAFITYTTAVIMHYCGFITLIYEKNLYSSLLFTGATVFFGYMIFMILDRYRFETKYGMLFKNIALILSQILISVSSILMII